MSAAAATPPASDTMSVITHAPQQRIVSPPRRLACYKKGRYIISVIDVFRLRGSAAAPGRHPPRDQPPFSSRGVNDPRDDGTFKTFFSAARRDGLFRPPSSAASGAWASEDTGSGLSAAATAAVSPSALPATATSFPAQQAARAPRSRCSCPPARAPAPRSSPPPAPPSPPRAPRSPALLPRFTWPRPSRRRRAPP